MDLEKRRIDCPDKEEQIYKTIKQEYLLFRYQMLSKNAKKVYKQHKKIYFYECMYEYIIYHEELLPEFIEAAYQKDSILSDLWKLYNKYEYFNVMHWKGIEEILLEYARRSKTIVF